MYPKQAIKKNKWGNNIQNVKIPRKKLNKYYLRNKD